MTQPGTIDEDALMGLQTRPEPGRPIITARQAAKMLSRDVRTIRRMIRDGELDGGARIGEKQRRWYVYLDQLQPAGPRTAPRAPATAEKSAEYRALHDQVTELQAQVASINDTNRLLLATQALILTAVDDYQQASTEFAGATEDQRALTERYHAAAGAYRSAADTFADALANYREIIAGLTTPQNISDLTTVTPRSARP